MVSLVRILLTALPILAVPSVAAQSRPATGITDVGPATFLFTIAAAILLMLVFRSTARHLTRYLTSRMGVIRIRRALSARSPDVLHDFILPGAYGGLAKIDHAIMTAGGILCIRSVHVNGVVFGGEDEAQWTNVDGAARRRFLNPLIQNEGRRRALQNIVPEAPVANLVIFTGDVEFPTPPPSNVIHVSQLESFISKFVFGPSKIEDWHAVWMSVGSAVLDDEATRRDFSAQIGFG